MKPFKHHNAQSLREATTLLRKYNGKAKANAGGTDILGAMRDRCMAEYPEALINIKTINGLEYIKEDKKGIRIGALTKLADIANSKKIKDTYKLLAEAVHSVATPHVRNMATVGGNLAQDVRCWYYRYPQQVGGPIVCLRKGGKICNALLGDSRYHSIFGGARLNEYPCSSNCPAGIDIPAYIEKVREGSSDEGAQILMEYNPIPAITGRICPIFCEPNCNRSEVDEPVAIRSIERGLGDYILRNAQRFYREPACESGKRVAIVGSGPAGLTAAYYLRKAGHRVVIFERFSKAGGMLMHSIPAYRLPRVVVEKQIEALQNMGIEIRVGVEVGSKVTLDQLTDDFDAIFVAAGSWKERLLGVEGEDLVLSGLQFLNQVSSGSKDIMGDRVAIVGGGNVAIDVARTLIGMGAKTVVLYRRTEEQMPAFRDEVEKARNEGVEFTFLTLPIHISRSGKEIVVTCIKMKLGALDGSGRPKPEPVQGSDYTMSFHRIIRAIGEEPDQALLPEEIRRMTQDSSVLSYRGKNIYLGGDFFTGPSTVIAAIASGRQNALAIESSLGGGQIPQDGKKMTIHKFAQFSSDVAAAHTRLKENIEPKGLTEFDTEKSIGVIDREIEKEAHHCFNCGCLAVGPSDVGTALVALNAQIVTTKRTVSAEEFFTASATCSTILNHDELIKEIRIPKPAPGTRQSYNKFTLRKPIDFAIVSVASSLTVDNGVCKEARIVLGGVAPEPLRAKKAEGFVNGQPLEEKSAAEAAELSLEGVIALPMNDYKVEIARTLVRRAMLDRTD